MSEFFDALEMRGSTEREAALLKALPLQVAHAKLASPAFAEILQDVNPAQVTSRTALAQLPVIRKHELLELQLKSRSKAGNIFGASAQKALAPICHVCLPVRARFTSLRALPKTTGAWRGRFLRLVFARVS